RDFHVTGVQTCALPISSRRDPAGRAAAAPRADPQALPGRAAACLGERAAAGRARRRADAAGPVPAAGALAHHHLRAAVSAPAGDIAGELRGPGADAAVAGGAGGSGRAVQEPAAPVEISSYL